MTQSIDIWLFDVVSPFPDAAILTSSNGDLVVNFVADDADASEEILIESLEMETVLLHPVSELDVWRDILYPFVLAEVSLKVSFGPFDGVVTLQKDIGPFFEIIAVAIVKVYPCFTGLIKFGGES